MGMAEFVLRVTLIVLLLQLIVCRPHPAIATINISCSDLEKCCHNKVADRQLQKTLTRYLMELFVAIISA